ncbi:hypothetical protein [Streptomyces sp. NBC_01803]|uniref:hypothetical protein n=1 Tax=Streptomyces sp. NBC_01803 TaxID=2975946 RepID=UPI002DD79E6C|nr:hypothetical protein [Streptomyces sp. NBC_01803]WSA43919.1 hypothetical protein OIE51_06730 [Streptomyces sp. NBC_01803]
MSDPYQSTGQPDLYLADGELGSFVGWLDECLASLRGSALSPDQIGRLDTAAHQFGDLPAADEIHARYEGVRARLERFVRAQQEAIELLGITTQLVQRDLVATDADQVDRLRQIMAGFASLYADDGGSTTPAGASPPGGGGGAPPMAR